MMISRFVAASSAAAIAVLLSVGSPARAGTEDEVRAAFDKFIAAENSHDLKGVGEIMQDSPQFLWVVARNAVWGREEALKRLEENFKGTWLLEPKYDQIKFTELSPGVAQLFVPAFLTSGPGKREFLITQIYVKTSRGWKLTSILPSPVR